ncbi:uncharacterized protein [Antedon mediterranea]|uniref:uncharacterized protein n=1 Tax=Antedon mediterranea TaxID=105859 RepID=UPI003AF7B436
MATRNPDDTENVVGKRETEPVEIAPNYSAVKEDVKEDDIAEQTDGSSDTSSWDSGPLSSSLKRYHPLPHERKSDLQYTPPSGTSNVMPAGIRSLRDQQSFNESTDLEDGIVRQVADSDYEACESSDETIDAEESEKSFDKPDDDAMESSKSFDEHEHSSLKKSETFFKAASESDKDQGDDKYKDKSEFDSVSPFTSPETRQFDNDMNVDGSLDNEQFEFLVHVLQDQHQQQIDLQKKQQENQLQFLSMQINKLILPSDKPARSHDKQERSDRQPQEELEPSSERAKPESSKVSDQMSETTESLAAVQQNFLEQQQKLQREYDQYLEDLQKQWISLHEQQTHQQKLLNNAISDQMQRITKTSPTEGNEQLMKRQQSSVKEDDDNSTVYSNFSYWRYDDTYRPLPKTHTRQDYTAFLDDTARDQSMPSMFSPDSQVSERLDLKEKHSRHIADLKYFYENEIFELKQQLHNSLSQNGGQPPLSAMQESNERYQQKCYQLEAALKLSSNRIEDLEATVKQLDTRLMDWPKKYGVAMSTITILEKQAESLNVLCADKDSELRDCKQTIDELKHYLHEAYELQGIKSMIADESQRPVDSLNKSEDELPEVIAPKSSLNDVDKRKQKTVEGSIESNHSSVLAEYDIKPMQLDRPVPSSYPHPSVQQPQAKVFVPSMEQRKFLTSGADFNLFNGEIKQSSDTEKESDKMESESESGVYQLADSDLDVSLNRSGLFASMRSTLHPPPFDSDLDERPISPMMKAAAQFNRWKHHEELEKSQSMLSDLSKNIENLPEVQRSSHQDLSTSSFVQSNEVKENVSVSTSPVFSLPEEKLDLNVETGQNKYRYNSKQSPPIREGVLSHESHSQRKPKLSENSPPRLSSSLTSSGNKRSPRTSETSKTSRRLFDHDPLNQFSPQSSNFKVKKKSPRSSLSNNLTSPYSPPRRSSYHKSSPSRPNSSSPKANRGSARKTQSASNSPRGSTPTRGTSTKISSKMHTFNPKVDVSPKYMGFTDKHRQTAARFSVSLDETPTKDYGIVPRKKWSTDPNTILKTLGQLKSDNVTNTGRDEPKLYSPSRKSDHSTSISKKTKSSIDDTINSLSAVEKNYDYLNKEKIKIESALSRLPPSTRMSRQSRETEEQLELRYDEVVKELGSIRMLLRKYNILKT